MLILVKGYMPFIFPNSARRVCAIRDAVWCRVMPCDAVCRVLGHSLPFAPDVMCCSANRTAQPLHRTSEALSRIDAILRLRLRLDW